MTGVSALSPLGWLRMAVSVDVVSWLSAHPPLSQPSCSTRSHLQGNVNHHSNEGLISGRICPPWLCGREGTSPPWRRLAVVASRGHACVSVLFPSVPPAPPCPPPAGFSPGFSASPLQLSAHRGHVGDPSSALRMSRTSRVKAGTFGAVTASLVASGGSLVSALN